MSPLWTEYVSAVSAAVSAVVAVVALAGVVFVLTQLKLQRTQLHRELENLYVERYWLIMDQYNEAALLPRRKGEAQRVGAIRSYLRLSQDECDLRTVDRVTDDTWREWRAGMTAQLADPAFAAALAVAPPDEFTTVRTLLDDPTFDPTRSNVRKRKRLGL